MNLRPVLLVSGILFLQWAMVIVGLWLIFDVVAPLHPFPGEYPSLGYYLGEGLKASIGLVLVALWLLFWKRLGKLSFWRMVRR